MKMHTLLLTILCTQFYIMSISQDLTLPLWSGDIPNSRLSDEKINYGDRDITWITGVQIPDIAVYLPTEKIATGQGVLICPGGGYAGLAYDWEGTDIAKWLNSKGIAGFVLKYRLPQSKSVVTARHAPLMDAQRAMRLIRSKSDEWNLKQNQIGVMGFSAGGHLASTLTMHHDELLVENYDPLDSFPAYPNFQILIYPVITFSPAYRHNGSKENLIGKKATDELIHFYSNENHVTENTPPTFLTHSTDDRSVPVENSLLMYKALKDQNIPVEMHIYPFGGHGFALALGQGYLSDWTNRLADWLEYVSAEN